MSQPTDRPFRVEFTFRTDLIEPGAAKTLDAVLSWAAVQRAECRGELDPAAFQHDVPLARHRVNDDWCFKASNLDFEWNANSQRSSVHYIKASRLRDYSNAWLDGLLDKRPQFDSQRGPTKAGSYCEPRRWADRAVAYGVGDVQALHELLPWVTHIGKLWHKDFGAVKDYRLITDGVAEDAWTRRVLPVGSPFACRHARGVGGLRSPYWKRDAHTEVMLCIE